MQQKKMKKSKEISFPPVKNSKKGSRINFGCLFSNNLIKMPRRGRVSPL